MAAGGEREVRAGGAESGLTESSPLVTRGKPGTFTRDSFPVTT